MTTRHKLTLINGTMDIESGIRTYWATNGVRVGSCPAGWPSVPPLPFPNDDDDWDDFDHAE